MSSRQWVQKMMMIVVVVVVVVMMVMIRVMMITMLMKIVMALLVVVVMMMTMTMAWICVAVVDMHTLISNLHGRLCAKKHTCGLKTAISVNGASDTNQSQHWRVEKTSADYILFHIPAIQRSNTHSRHRSCSTNSPSLPRPTLLSLPRLCYLWK